MASWRTLRNDRAALRSYLDALDARLALPSGRVEIHARVIRAWMTIQEEFGVAMDIGSEDMNLVERYFNEKYGARALWETSIGRMLIKIGHEAWAVRFPLVFGTHRIYLRDVLEGGSTTAADRLTKPEQKALAELLPKAFNAFSALRFLPSKLQVDWRTAVDQAIDPRGDPGVSKWSSEQAVEKILAAFIVAHGGELPVQAQHRHELGPMAEAAEDVGLRLVDRGHLARVQCKATIRYPSNSTQLTEAVLANQAAVLICGGIAESWRAGRPVRTASSEPSVSPSRSSPPWRCYGR